MESFSLIDPDCETYCGPKLPYMIYNGDPFCAQDANEEGKWDYMDWAQSSTARVQDPPIVSKCMD